jgi:hypothetical protein
MFTQQVIRYGCAREYIDDMEDIDLASERLSLPGETYSALEVKRQLNLKCV